MARRRSEGGARLQGLVQSIGAARLGELAVAVEQAGRQQRRDGVGKLLGEIEGEAEVVARELRSAARLTPADAGAVGGLPFRSGDLAGPLRNRLGGGRDVCLRQFDGLGVLLLKLS